MSAPAQVPRIDLQAVDECAIYYDAAADVAVVTIDPRADARIEVDEGWYLRVAGRYATGVELHGLRRLAYGDPFLAQLLRGALIELDRGPNRDPLGVLADSIARSGDTTTRPQLVRLAIALTGIAVGKLSRKEERGAK